MKLKDLQPVIPCGQLVLVRNYQDEEEVYFDDDNQFLIGSKYDDIMELEVKMVTSQNDCERTDYLIIEVE